MSLFIYAVQGQNTAIQELKMTVPRFECKFITFIRSLTL